MILKLGVGCLMLADTSACGRLCLQPGPPLREPQASCPEGFRFRTTRVFEVGCPQEEHPWCWKHAAAPLSTVLACLLQEPSWAWEELWRSTARGTGSWLIA